MAGDFDELDDKGWDEFQRGIEGGDGQAGDQEDPLDKYQDMERKDINEATETWKAAERTANAHKEAERLRLQNTKAVIEANRQSSERSDKWLRDIAPATTEIVRRDKENFDKLIVIGSGCFIAGIIIGIIVGRRGSR